MKQTKISSFIESIVNVLIGYFIGVTSQLLIFPIFGVHISLGDNMLIGVYFTVISITRSYIVRRWFNARLHKLITGE